MPGPVRRETAANSRTNPLNPPNGKPPRPPNAWILYRSEKLKIIPPPGPGEARRPQADISRLISDMWKAESTEVRAHYERLSDIKKAEHQEKYPNYRFQPMKREEKERLRAERQAEKERERQERKAKGKARGANSRVPPPLFTTDARLPSGASPPAAFGASTPSPGLPTPPSQPYQEAGPSSQPVSHPDTVAPTSVAQPMTPAADTPTPLALPTPSSVVEPSLIVSQGAPSVDEWLQVDTQVGDPSTFDFAQFWNQPSSFSSDPGPSNPQEYLSVPLPNATFPQHLSLGPDDSAQFSELSSLFTGTNDPQPLHAVLSATDNPNIFNLENFDWDVNELFDGTREIEVTMGPSITPNAVADCSQFGGLSSLFADFGSSNSLFQQHTTNEDAEVSIMGAGTSYDTVSMSQSSGMDLINYSFDGFVHDTPSQTTAASEEEVHTPDRVGAATPTPKDSYVQTTNPVSAPYMPPSGAANSSTRRVAADWRHVRALSPEPQTPRAQAAEPVWW